VPHVFWKKDDAGGSQFLQGPFECFDQLGKDHAPQVSRVAIVNGRIDIIGLNVIVDVFEERHTGVGRALERSKRAVRRG
jgi:hypothetical protein